MSGKLYVNLAITLPLESNLPITDMSVDTAVSVAVMASWRTLDEHDSMDVMEKPIGLYLQM